MQDILDETLIAILKNPQIINITKNLVSPIKMSPPLALDGNFFFPNGEDNILNQNEEKRWKRRSQLAFKAFLGRKWTNGVCLKQTEISYYIEKLHIALMVL